MRAKVYLPCIPSPATAGNGVPGRRIWTGGDSDNLRVLAQRLAELRAGPCAWMYNLERFFFFVFVLLPLYEPTSEMDKPETHSTED